MPEESAPLPDPNRPNKVWLTFRFLLGLVFVLWLGSRIRGLRKLPEVGGGLFLVNHQSFIDPLIAQLGMNRPVSWLARDSLFPVPIIGWILRKTYVMPISRESAGTGSIREAVRRMKHGFIVGIFPEGTRTRDGRIGEFKPGFVALVRRGKVPVYPVGIAGANLALPRNAWFLRPRRVRVVIGDPFTPEEVQELTKRGHEEDMVKAARDRVVACHEEAERWRLGKE